MELSWLGQACFRIRGKDATVVTDPYSRGGSALARVTAEIVTISHPDPALSSANAVGGTPKVLEGPGEYEAGGVFVTGVRTYRDKVKGRERGKNTAYLIEIDEVVVCHLGDLGHVPTAEQVEQMSKIDVLLVPIGEGASLEPSAVAETVQRLEPKIIVPMLLRSASQESDALQKFLAELGGQQATPQARLVVTRATLPQQTQVTVLEARG